MGKVKAQLSVSLDGYMAGPNQSEENPLGEGGMALHEWVVKLASWQQAHGREEGEGDENPSNAVIEAAKADVGAVVMGRNMFGPVRGPWGEEDWRGWWGEEPPFHVPTFVLTHHEREPLEMEGGTTFHFVTEGIESAILQAKEVAGDKDVSVGGGASAIQQCIAAGLLDELLINQVPILLGGGTRLLDGLEPGAGIELTEVVEGPDALHLRYALSY
ncbi:MAG TPA: dihydrofolate reductase family protein [Solirubrobacterales bacterium]|jgi:dihydrofolate reductase|nr:dihydrofolate reductase family protein [Solirubrobacterales bacterium]